MENKTAKVLYKKDTRLIIVIYSIILTLSLVASFSGGNIPGLDKALVRLSAKDFVPNISAVVLKPGTNKEFIYESEFGKVNLSGNNEAVGVLIPRFASNGYMVYLNETLIGQYGSSDHEASNIWNGSAFMTFPSKLLNEHNSLKIVSRAEYKTGLTTNDVYIMPYESGVAFQNRFEFYNHVLVYVEMGILLLSAAFMILMSITSKQHRVVYFFLAMGMLSIGAYSIDYTPILELPLAYFNYKKIVMLCYWATTLFYGIGIGKLFKFRWAVVSGIAGFIGIILIVLFSQDMVQFKNAYTLWYVTQLLSVILWVVAAARVYKSRIDGRVFVIGLSVLGLYSAINMVIDMSGGVFSMNSPLLYMAVFSIIPLMTVYFDVLNREALLRNESELRKTADSLANLDVLTDAYNKRYFTKVINEFPTPYTLALFDIDDFKLINDCYGHQAGDEVLIHIVKQIGRHMRKADILCRIGGDEFAMLLPVTVEKAVSRFKDFKGELEQENMRYLGKEISFTMSFGLCCVEDSESDENSIRYADMALYESKQKGKNQISVYHKMKSK